MYLLLDQVCAYRYSEQTLQRHVRRHPVPVRAVVLFGLMPNKNRKVLVTCSQCHATWEKRSDSIPSWNGRCRSCAYKLRFEDPEYQSRHSENARAQVVAQGGVPNAKKFEHGVRGPDHISWKGGLTPKSLQGRGYNEAKSFRSAVLERDGHKCTNCGTGERLEVHHVLPWSTHPERRYDASNGLTLCRPCHMSLHAEARKSKA